MDYNEYANTTQIMILERYNHGTTSQQHVKDGCLSSKRCNQLIIGYHRLQINLNLRVMSNFFALMFLFTSCTPYTHIRIAKVYLFRHFM